MIIDMFSITNRMGKSNDWFDLSELSDDNICVLNDISYGSNKCLTQTEYLNSLNPSIQYGIEQVSYNNSDFTETFVVARVTLD